MTFVAKDSKNQSTTCNHNKGTRARVDLTRSQGNQNAVASGVDLSRVGIIGESELNRIREIACKDDRAHLEELARQETETRRKNISATKSAQWPDTAEARHAAFLQSQRNAIAEAEKRKAVLDQLHAEEEEADHREMLARAKLRALRDDPRGRNAESLTLLHNVIKEREVQKAYNNEMRKDDQEAREAEKNALLLANWAAEAEAAQRELRARELDVANRNANLEMVLCQIEERKAEKLSSKDRRSSVERAAAEEASENALEEQIKQKAEKANGEFNALHARSALKKSERLEQRIKDEQHVLSELEQELARTDALKRAAEQRRNERLAAFEQRKQRATQVVEELNKPSNNPKHRTQDRFANADGGAVSFMDKMFDSDVERTCRSRAVAKQIGDLASSQLQDKQLAKCNKAESTKEDDITNNNNNDDEDNVDVDANNELQYHTAAASASGFLNAHEEKEYLKEMRQYPAKLASITQKENAARRAEAQRVAEIQRLQAGEKRSNAERVKQDELAEAIAQREYSAADDAKYRSFLKSELPNDLDEFLLQKAMKLSEA